MELNVLQSVITSILTITELSIVFHNAKIIQLIHHYNIVIIKNV